MTDEEREKAIAQLERISQKLASIDEDKDYTWVAIEALEQETKTDGDCISRQAVEEITWEEPSYTDALNVLTEVREKIRQLPSVKPQEPKTGHWIEYTKVVIPEPINSWKQAWKCSECGYGGQDDDEDGWLEWNYCPNCGARMSEVANDNTI